jgi:hypothetical protein
VTNVGTKDIFVRAKISGEWQEEKDGAWVKWGDDWTPDSDEDVPIIEIKGDNWIWKDDDGYLYYTESLDGTYNGHEERINPTAELVIELDLVGEDTGNDYQGNRFVLSVEFEAIQASNEASVDRWGWRPPKID